MMHVDSAFRRLFHFVTRFLTAWLDACLGIACLLYCFRPFSLPFSSSSVNWRYQQPVLEGRLEAATTYDEWSEAADELDEVVPEIRDWKATNASRYYDVEMIAQRRDTIVAALRRRRVSGDGTQPDWHTMERLLRTGLRRNLGHITRDELFKHSYAGTKVLIERYIDGMVGIVREYATSPAPATGSISFRESLLRDARRSHGRTALVLQGGSMFGFCHIGVMKALHGLNLLPNIIVGTASGALMAALIGIHDDEELPGFLNGEAIDLSAFANSGSGSFWSLKTLNRLFATGYVLEHERLRECVKANAGDMTFREAYRKTGRILSITISSDNPSVPGCLNYLTTPEVVIRTAAIASSISDPVAASLFILEKRNNTLRPWSLAVSAADARAHWSPTLRTRLADQAAAANNRPIARVVQLFNVNHFIISQARPYLVPLLAPRRLLPSVWKAHPHRPPPQKRLLTRLLSPSTYLSITTTLLRREMSHRLRQLHKFHFLPRSLDRFFSDEALPPFSALVLVPDMSWSDFLRLMQPPKKEQMSHWILQGERSVWPAVGPLRVRCRVEKALEEGVGLLEERARSGRERVRSQGEALGEGQGTGVARRRRSVHIA